VIFKARYERLGGHVTVTIFSATAANHTFANLGSLTMDERDWESFRRSIKLRVSESIPDSWMLEEHGGHWEERDGPTCRWCGRTERLHPSMTVEGRLVRFCDHNEHTTFCPVAVPA
jgi:hypothetical protein